MEKITALSSRAVQEYEGLREECEKVKMECQKMQRERDEALEKLKEFERVSHRVVEEVGVIQENLEIEKSCRENAEALASKLNRQNRSLKRKSMMLLSHVRPEILATISLEDEDETERTEKEAPCTSAHCQNIITGKHNRVTSHSNSDVNYHQ